MMKCSSRLLRENRYGVRLAVFAAAMALLSPQVGQAQYGQYGGPGEQVQYPSPQPPAERVETNIGPLKVRPYGTLLMNIQLSDTVIDDIPLWARTDASLVTFPDGSRRRNGEIHDLVFTARQSVFGVNLSPASPPTSGWIPSAGLRD